MLILDLNKPSLNYLYKLNIETKKTLYLLSIKIFKTTHIKTQQIQDSKISILTYEFDAKELNYIFSSNLHETLVTNLIDQLSKVLFKFNTKQYQELKISPLLICATFADNTLKLEILSEILPLIQDLYSIQSNRKIKGQKFDSEHSAAFYEILKKAHNRKRIIYDLDELREILGTTYNTEDETVINYEKWSQFKEKVIETAKNELELKSDIYFEYEPLYKGRKIVELLIKPLFKPKVNNEINTKTCDNTVIKPEIETDSFSRNSTVEKENEIISEKIQSYTESHSYRTWKKDLNGFISFNEMMFNERKSFSIKK